MGNSKIIFLNKKTILLMIAAIAVSSCVPSTKSDLRKRSSVNGSTSVAVNINQGKVLMDNPVILSKNAKLPVSTDLNKFTSAQFISELPILQGFSNCVGLSHCFEVKDNINSSSPLISSDNKWGYKTNTSEFLQVNTYYHLNKSFQKYLENLNLTHNTLFSGTTYKRETAIPLSIMQGGFYNLNSKTLNAYSNCDEADNSYFSAAQNSLCFGYSGQNKNLFWAHDSTVIYHEFGHFIQHLQLNFRNSNQIIKASMGNFLYNEAGAIGEGLSDYFSYYINGRTHWGEWAAGNLLASRPLSEMDNLHAASLQDDNDHRLRYPDYLTYEPNVPTIPVEAVHNAGMIISHYLVALTKDLEVKCQLNNLKARDSVMMLINETMAELGDLTSVGTQPNTTTALVNKINLSPDYSSEWFNKNNPLNYRSFTQTLAKNLLLHFGTFGNSFCNGSFYAKDEIETLIDSYGLLNFKSYNQHRNHTSVSKVNTVVNAANRNKTTLITKAHLKFDPLETSPTAFVIDNREEILAGVTSLKTSGVIKDISAQTPSDLGFNNDNGDVSPGEIVAIALNLYNDSNATMGGVQVLANDWFHADATGKPCPITSTFAEDKWPKIEEGASESSDCLAVKAQTPNHFAPVCFIQAIDGNSSKWVSQEQFLEKINADKMQCLDPTNPKDCFIRAIKGADSAFYSKLDPKKTFTQTMKDPESNKSYGLNWGNVILFEVSKQIPPSSTISCRLRARFTNCTDCYHDDQGLAPQGTDDYKDEDYNGSRPFQVLHLNMTIK